jgi:hypothetical protein
VAVAERVVADDPGEAEVANFYLQKNSVLKNLPSFTPAVFDLTTHIHTPELRQGIVFLVATSNYICNICTYQLCMDTQREFKNKHILMFVLLRN